MSRIYLFIFLCLLSNPGFAKDNIWLLIDTGKLTLEVKQGLKTVELFKNISIGKNGAGFKQRRGDLVTPIGTYRIGWINNNSHYRKFFGVTYPSQLNAFEALFKGLIDQEDYKQIKLSHQHRQIPKQNTRIGGNIGIHGLGSASQRIHRTMNWTQGCIALTNPQVDRLAHWVDKGTLVTIK
jgi:murein L,D-transpeptidase YafK